MVMHEVCRNMEWFFKDKILKVGLDTRLKEQGHRKGFKRLNKHWN